MSAKHVDYTGQKFNMLTVISFEGTKERLRHDRPSNYTETLWKVKCDCGVVKVTRIYPIIRGLVKSCGCYKSIWKKAFLAPSIDLVKHQIHGSYRKAASNRGYVFKLTIEDVWSTIQQDCYYCGSPPLRVVHPQNRKNENFYCNGIDRVDNKEGYLHTNIVPCCAQCNICKSNYSKDDFLSWVSRVHNHQYNKVGV